MPDRFDVRELVSIQTVRKYPRDGKVIIYLEIENPSGKPIVVEKEFDEDIWNQIINSRAWWHKDLHKQEES